MTTLNLQVGASTDDAGEDLDGIVGLNWSWVPLADGSPWTQNGGVRFTGVSGLSGSTIDAATLTFRARFSDSGAFVGDWYAHDAEAPPTFNFTTYNISDTAQRPRTTATCEGDGSDFGSWTADSDHTFTGDGVNTIADIIQELADSYDPSAIALLWIYTSGDGERFFRTWDYNTSLAPKLDIDYSAGAGEQTLTPSGIASLEAFGAATVSLAAQTLSPSGIASAEAFGSAQLNLAFTATGIASAEAFGAASISTAVTISAGGIASQEAFGAATVSTIVTLSPSGIASAEAFGSAVITTGVVTLSPAGIASLEAFGSAVLTTTVSISAGGITSAEAFGSAQLNLAFTASGIASLEAFGAATVTTGVIFSAYGNWRALIDPGDYPTGAEFFFEAIIATSNASLPSYARLYNITDAAVVADSQVQSVDTTEDRVRSSALSLPAAPKEYRCERGGSAGATYKCYGARVLAKSG